MTDSFHSSRETWSQYIDLAPNVWLHSSVGRATHRQRGGHGFESRWSSEFFFFRLLLSNCLNWKIYCDDHSFLSLTLLLASRLNFGTLSLRIWENSQSMLLRNKHTIYYYLIFKDGIVMLIQTPFSNWLETVCYANTDRLFQLTGKFTAMITLYFQLQPQFKYELFHILHIISLLTGDMNSINWPRSQCVAS